MLAPRPRLRRAWAVGGGALIVVRPRLHGRQPAEPRRASTTSSRSAASRTQPPPPAARAGASSAALRCGAVSVPTHKLIPDIALGLDLPRERRRRALRPVAQRAQRKARYGVAIFPVGRTNILRTGFAVNTDAITQVPGPGFQRSRPTEYFAAYLRCPPARCARRRAAPRRRRRPGVALGGACCALALRAAAVGHQARAAARLQRRRGLELRPDGGRLLLQRQLQPALLHQPAGVLVPAARGVRASGSAAATASAQRASRPTRPTVFAVARATSAVLGTARGRVPLPDRARACTTGASALRRRGADGGRLPARLLLAPRAQRRARAAAARARVYGSAGVLSARARARLRARGRRARPRGGDQVHGRDRAAAAARRGRGAARRRRGRARAVRGVALAGGRRGRASWSRTRTRCCRSTSSGGLAQQEEAAAGFGKLGLDSRLRASLYYLWVLTWGLGWVPAAGRAGRRGRWRVRDGCARAVPRPVAARVHRSTWARRTASSAAGCCPRSRARLLAACAAVGARGCAIAARAPRAARRRWPRSPASRCCAQGLVYSVHVDRVLVARRHAQPGPRLDGRATSRAGSKVVVEPIVPDAWFATDVGAAARPRPRTGGRWIKFPTGRTTIDADGAPRPGGKGRSSTSRTTSARCAPRSSAPTRAAATAGS